MSADVVSIIALSTLAGLATGLGGLVVLILKPGEKLLVFLMGLAGGIMIMTSFLELLFESLKISGLFIELQASWQVHLCCSSWTFFCLMSISL
jgi:zinc transporter ZupT